MKHFNIIFFIATLMLFLSCDNIFEYSVYEANVKKEYRNTTAKNLDLINEKQSETDDFKFAVISDNHFFYNELSKVIDDINTKDDISFVIVAGDITQLGLLKEYDIFYNALKKLKKPYVTVIGNHDYSSNGNIIYNAMFGDFNYSFEFNKNKFVFFDNIVWESNKNPDFDWLSNEVNNNTSFNNVFVIAHIPPFGDQFTDEMEQTYSSIMLDNNIELSIHGHIHTYSYEKIYDNFVNYLTIPSTSKEAYCIVSVQNDSFNIDLIKL